MPEHKAWSRAASLAGFYPRRTRWQCILQYKCHNLVSLAGKLRWLSQHRTPYRYHQQSCRVVFCFAFCTMREVHALRIWQRQQETCAMLRA